MTIHELLAKFDAKDIVIQRLDESTTNITKVGKGTDARITFATDQLSPKDLVSRPWKIGLVLWISADKWDEVTKSIE